AVESHLPWHLRLYSQLLPHEQLVREVITRSRAHGFSCANCFDDAGQSPASIPYVTCKTENLAFIALFAASLVITPLVPGFPSLDAKLRSPGETRRSERKKQERRRMKCRKA